MKISRNNGAISQIIGEIILLAIAVTSVSVLYTQVLSKPGPQDTTTVTIIGKIQDGCPVFDLQRGESLGRDSKLYINIAGEYNRSVYSLDQSLFDPYIHNHEWNIGEQIILPPTNIPTYKGPRVEGTIVDTKTNAIVFWGILQEGIVTRYKGGIWHFDEPSWNGTPDEVKDSSGNLNHGIAKNGAKIINGTSQPLLTKNNNSGYFDGTNYIEVETSWSLNMTNQITVEAWMKPNTSSDLISSTSKIEQAFGYTPYIIHALGNYYAIVSEDKQKGGMLQTVEIAPNGEKATLAPYHSLINFGTSTSHEFLRPMITKMKENMVLIAFNNKTGGNVLMMELRTYNISTNGSINYTGYNRVLPETYPHNQNRPSLIKITDNLAAIAYWTPSDGIVLKTLNISSTGNITPIMTYNNTDYGYEPYLFHVDGEVYALAYRSTSNQGIIKTFNFDLDPFGTIQPIRSWVYSKTAAFEPCVIHVSGNVFAVVYRNDSTEGLAKTFKILPNGFFEPMPELQRGIFEEASCCDPCIVHDVDDSYVVVYSTKDDDGSNPTGQGMVISLKLEKNGLITITNSGKPFDSDKCFTPIILPINEHIFAITYTGTGSSGHPGWLITIAYADQQGIFKGDAFMICSKTNQIEGRINNVKIYYNNTNLGSNWHHVALTYDGTNIRLYVDGGIPKSVKPYPYPYPNNGIKLVKDDLNLGRNYHGYIDEIAIYEKALDQCQINCIFNHPKIPGILEYYLLGVNCGPENYCP